MDNQDYTKRFSRNIGILSQVEQDQIKQMTVSVAGVGGIGGHVLSNLARMGFQNFLIADLDKFDYSNTNRQIGATDQTIGQEKVQVLKKLLTDINPHASVKVFPAGIQETNVDEFVSASDVVVDSLDFFVITPRKLIYKACQKFRKSVFLSAPLGFSATLQVFTPKSMTPDTYFGWNDKQTKFEQLILFSLGIAPKGLHTKYLKFDREFLMRNKTGPSISTACTIGGALVANEVLYYVLNKRAPFQAPCYTQFDPFAGKYVRKKLRFGAKGLIQQLKFYFAKKYYGAYQEEFSKFIQ